MKNREQRPVGRELTITQGISSLQGYMFDLFVATHNLLESYDQSTQSLMDAVMNDESSRQDILSAIVNELSDLESKDIVNIQHEFNGGEHPSFIIKKPFDIEQ